VLHCGKYAVTAVVIFECNCNIILLTLLYLHFYYIGCGDWKALFTWCICWLIWWLTFRCGS